MKNERDSLTRVNSSNPRTVLGVRIGARTRTCLGFDIIRRFARSPRKSAELWGRTALTDTILNVRLVNA
jgi:hypothetical protein